MEQLREHKGYILGIVITSLIGGIATSFDPKITDGYTLHIFATTMLAIAMNCLIGLVILLVSWIFSRQITISRFFKFSSIICIIWSLTAVINAVLQFNRDI